MTKFDHIMRAHEEWKRDTLYGKYKPEEINWLNYEKAAREPLSPSDTAPDINPIDWFSHALLVAAQGSGKTNLIRWRINQILPEIKEGRATLILLDPKDVLTRELPTLARAMGMEDRTILIDPLEAPVSFNLFDKGDGSEGAIHDTIARLIRLLNTITLDLTPFQRDALTVTISALFAVSDNPSFDELFPILRHGKDAMQLDKLPPETRDIFQYDFRENDGRLVVSRLNSFRNNPFFRPLVHNTAPHFDLAAAMQEGKLILIKAGIKEPLYGKIWIEQIDRIIDSRFDLPESERTPTHVIIDEAQVFIGDHHSDHFADILDRAREAKIGMFIACQHMDQINHSHVRASLYNSALKFVAKTNADLHALARSMTGDIDANRFRTIPRYHFLHCSPDTAEAELIKLPVVSFPQYKREDIHYFRRQLKQQAPAAGPYQPPIETRQPVPTPTLPPTPLKPRKRRGPTDEDPY